MRRIKVELVVFGVEMNNACYEFIELKDIVDFFGYVPSQISRSKIKM